MLAPDEENTRIPAYSAQANAVCLRGVSVLNHLAALERRPPQEIEVPQDAVDVRKFFRSSALGEKFGILQRYGVDYVMVRAVSPLNRKPRRWPGFTTIDTPGAGYNLYAVNRQRLGRPSSGSNTSRP